MFDRDQLLTAVRARRAQIETAAKSLTDEAALAQLWMFPQWQAGGQAYAQGDRVRADGELYRCLKAHTSQENQGPGMEPSLWERVAAADTDWPAWKMPENEEEAYSKGDKASHCGKRWTSDVDVNMGEPGVFGWTEAAG